MMLPYFDQASLWNAIASAPGQGGEPGSAAIIHPPGSLPMLLCPSSPEPPSAGSVNPKWGGPGRSYHLSLGNGLFWAQASGLAAYTVLTILPPNGPSCGYFPTVSSRHTGGVQVVLADGAVRFISDSIDAGNQSAAPPTNSYGPSPYGVWGALGSAQGGEPTSEF